MSLKKSTIILMRSSINFKEIFENYNSNLLNKLRGFGENKEYEFYSSGYLKKINLKIFKLINCYF